jgi:VWFA-related protein
MRNSCRWKGAILVAAIAVGASAALTAQAVQRSLYVSVVDQAGVPVAGLGPADFIVREDRVAREVLRVAPADDPMQIALLVDNSQAAEPYIRDYREALPAFIAAMGASGGPKAEISLIAIGERPTILSQYTSDPAELQKAVQRVFSMSGSATYLLDGIIETSQGLTKRAAQRPVIVAVTTEGPELSDRHFEQVLSPLKASGAAFHVVTIGRPSNMEHDRSVVLDQGTKESGGRYDTILMGTALTARMKDIARDLRSQYRVTYARPQTLIPPERVTVDAANPAQTARGTAVREEREAKRP